MEGFGTVAIKGLDHKIVRLRIRLCTDSIEEKFRTSTPDAVHLASLATPVLYSS